MTSKYILLILLLLSIQNRYSTCRADEDSGINIRVTKHPKLSYSHKNDWLFYPIEIRLINKTDSVIHYGTLSCFWQEVFIIDSKCCFLSGSVACDHNSLTIDSIAPNKITTLNSGIYIDRSCVKSKKNKVRIGFILVRDDEIKTFLDFDKLLSERRINKNNAIWSNLIYLK